MLQQISDQVQAIAQAIASVVSTQIKHEGLEQGVSRWIPEWISPSDKQRYWLQHDFEEAHYGGALMGGKTGGLLMAALKFFDIPGYRAVIFRKNMRMIEEDEGLQQQLLEWVEGKGATWNVNKHTLTSPCGAKIHFAHLNLDSHLDNYIGGAYHFLGFDQLEQLNPRHYRRLFARLRKTKRMSHIPLRVYSTSNPDPGAMWVYDHFIKEAEDIDEIAQEKEHINDEGYRWKSVFIPAFLADNPGADQESYNRSIAHLTIEERLRATKGDWFSRDKGDVLHTYSGPHSLITKTEWKKLIGLVDWRGNPIASNALEDLIPLDYRLMSGFDWGQTRGHDTAGSWAAQPPKGAPLPQDTVVVYREKVWLKPTEPIFAAELKKVETLKHERMRMIWSVFSHEQLTVRNTLSTHYGIHFSGSLPNNKAGLSNMRAYMTVIDTDKPCPHRPDLMGRSRMLFLVDDNQGELMERENWNIDDDPEEQFRWYCQSASDEEGLIRHRAEIQSLRWKDKKDGTNQEEVESGFDDMYHAQRNWAQKLTPVSIDTLRDNPNLPEELKMANILQQPQVSQQRLLLKRQVELSILRKIHPVQLPHYKRRLI